MTILDCQPPNDKVATLLEQTTETEFPTLEPRRFASSKY
jgi:hypothetical protein